MKETFRSVVRCLMHFGLTGRREVPMKNVPPSRPNWSRIAAIRLGAAFIVAWVAVFGGCERPSSSDAQSGGNAITDSIEPRIEGPARVTDATLAFDILTIPLMHGAEAPSERTAASLMYRSGATVENAFKFHQAQLIEKGWKEFPGSTIASHSASATF